MELTKDNYLYGIGSGKTWHVNIDPPKKKVRSYFEETVEAVEYVYANKIGKFQVLYSGGVDSQYVCEVLLRLGIEFEPVIIDFKSSAGHSYNQHDIKYAYEFCHSRNLNPITYDLDLDKFIDSGIGVEIARSVESCSAIIPAQLYVIEKLDGFTLLGNDPPYLRFDKDKKVWYLEELQYIHSLMRYYKKFNLNGCPFLLSYTPEMMLSFLIDPSIKKLGTGQLPGRLGTNSTKSHVFNNVSNFNIPTYDFKNNSRVKYHGFEEVYKSKIAQHPNIMIFKEFWKIWNGEYLESYVDAVQRLSIHQD